MQLTRTDLEELLEGGWRTAADAVKEILELRATVRRLSNANAVMLRRLAEIATGEAYQPVIHAGAGIREAEEILNDK